MDPVQSINKKTSPPPNPADMDRLEDLQTAGNGNKPQLTAEVANEDQAEANLPDLAELNRIASPIKVKIITNKSSDEEILERARTAMYKYADEFAEKLGLDKDKVRKILPEPKIMEKDKQSKSSNVGTYNTNDHTIELNPKGFLNSDCTPEGIAVHEANHAVEAALRTCLGLNRVKKIFLSVVCSEIINGTTGLISNGISSFQPPVISAREMRKEIAGFLFKLINKPDETPGLTETHTIQLHEERFEFRKLTDKGIKELGDKLKQKIPEDYKAFLDYFRGDEESALYTLRRYIDANIFRYNLSFNSSSFYGSSVIPENVMKIDLELTPKAKEFALNSAEGFLSLFEGNYLYQFAESIGGLSKDTALGYTFAPEEVRCKRIEINAELEIAKSPEEVEKLNARAKAYDLGEKLMALRRNMSLAPRDSEKYSVLLTHHVLGGKSHDIAQRLDFSFADLADDLEQCGKITQDRTLKSKEQLSLEENFGKFLALHNLINSFLVRGNPDLDKFKEIAKESSNALRQVAAIYSSLISGKQEKINKFLKIVEEKERANISLMESVLEVKKRTDFSLDRPETLLDKSVDENNTLVQNIKKIEKEISELLPKAKISTLKITIDLLRPLLRF